MEMNNCGDYTLGARVFVQNVNQQIFLERKNILSVTIVDTVC